MKEFDKNIEIDFLINELISKNERIDNNMALMTMKRKENCLEH